MTNYLNEAFQKLSLVEDDFNFTARDTDVTDELKSFVADDIDIVDEEPIIDVEAETEDDLQDTYVGKVIIECDCCHARIFKNRADVIIDEETGLANIEEVCPVCGEKGWNVVGKIEEFEPNNEADEEPGEDFPLDNDDVKEIGSTLEDEPEGEEVEESLKEAFKEAYGEEDDPSDDVPVTENALMDRVRAKLELGEAEEKFPDKAKHEYVETYKGVKIYWCEETGKYAAKLNGKKVENKSIDELKEAIEKATTKAPIKEGANMAKLRNKLSLKKNPRVVADEDDDFEESFNPKKVRAKLMGEECEDGSCEEAFDPDRVRAKLMREDCEDGICEGTEEDDKAALEDPDYFMDIANKNADRNNMRLKDLAKIELGKEANEAFNPEKVRAKLMGEGLDEALHVQADGEDSVDIDKNDDGSMDIHVGSIGPDDIPFEPEDTEGLEAGDEMIAPLSDEDEEEIKANQPEDEEESEVEEEPTEEEAEDEEESEVEEEPTEEEEAEDEEDLDIEDFDEESFDNMGESYVRKVFEDVDTYKTTGVSVGDRLVVEGLITMKNGSTKNTKFVFENASFSKQGKIILEGTNSTFTNAKHAFILKGSLNDKKFIGESMLYNYPVKALNESNEMETFKCYGRVKAEK